ncbi:hypothetical protein CBS101457_005362 [Exobasidium rhododendri]|nr:hypothetical protein CBS101457_005362 [Exobasidium rhododendri]
MEVVEEMSMAGANVEYEMMQDEVVSTGVEVAEDQAMDYSAPGSTLANEEEEEEEEAEEDEYEVEMREYEEEGGVEGGERIEDFQPGEEEAGQVDAPVAILDGDEHIGEEMSDEEHLELGDNGDEQLTEEAIGDEQPEGEAIDDGQVEEENYHEEQIVSEVEQDYSNKREEAVATEAEQYEDDEDDAEKGRLMEMPHGEEGLEVEGTGQAEEQENTKTEHSGNLGPAAKAEAQEPATKDEEAAADKKYTGETMQNEPGETTQDEADEPAESENYEAGANAGGAAESVAATAGADQLGDEVVSTSEDGQNDEEEDVDAPPAIRITFNDQDFVLFSESEPSSYISTQKEEIVSAPQLKADPKAFHESLDTLFQSLRVKDSLGDFLEEGSELQISFVDLDMMLREDDVYAREISLSDIYRIHVGFGFSSSLHLVVSETIRFLTRYNELAAQVSSVIAQEVEDQTSQIFGEDREDLTHVDDGVAITGEQEEANAEPGQVEADQTDGFQIEQSNEGVYEEGEEVEEARVEEDGEEGELEEGTRETSEQTRESDLQEQYASREGQGQGEKTNATAIRISPAGNGEEVPHSEEQREESYQEENNEGKELPAEETDEAEDGEEIIDYEEAYGSNYGRKGAELEGEVGAEIVYKNDNGEDQSYDEDKTGSAVRQKRPYENGQEEGEDSGDAIIENSETESKRAKVGRIDEA